MASFTMMPVVAARPAAATRTAAARPAAAKPFTGKAPKYTLKALVQRQQAVQVGYHGGGVIPAELRATRCGRKPHQSRKAPSWVLRLAAEAPEARTNAYTQGGADTSGQQRPGTSGARSVLPTPAGGLAGGCCKPGGPRAGLQAAVQVRGCRRPPAARSARARSPPHRPADRCCAALCCAVQGKGTRVVATMAKKSVGDLSKVRTRD